MPRYKFHWTNLARPLLDALYDDLQFDTDPDDPAEALHSWYGARPKDDFVHDAWPTLLKHWIAHDTGARNTIVASLREIRHEEGRLTKHRDQMATCMDCATRRTCARSCWQSSSPSARRYGSPSRHPNSQRRSPARDNTRNHSSPPRPDSEIT